MQVPNRYEYVLTPASIKQYFLLSFNPNIKINKLCDFQNRKKIAIATHSNGDKPCDREVYIEDK